MNRRVVHMTSVHSWNDVRILYKECRALSKAGYEVRLIVPKRFTDEGIGERWGSVSLVWVSAPRNRLWRMTITALEVLRQALRQDASVYHFHDPELIPVGMVLRRLGKTVIYDVHEDVPKQVLSKPWIHRSLRRIVAKGMDVVERAAARMFDGIVAATPPIAVRFPKDKTVVVQNFPLLSEFALQSGTPYRERPFNVVYLGGITALRGAVEMVRAMELLPPEIPAKLLLAGAFEADSLLADLKALPGWKRVEYLGMLSRKEVGGLLGISRVGLVLLHPVPNYLEAYPVKLFEYMAAGIPVVASNFPLWREIVEEVGCGLLVDPHKPDEIAEGIAWLLRNPEEAEAMGQRGRKAVLEKYNWERESEKLQELYRRFC